jgi:hypothetical protein
LNKRHTGTGTYVHFKNFTLVFPLLCWHTADLLQWRHIRYSVTMNVFVCLPPSLWKIRLVTFRFLKGGEHLRHSTLAHGHTEDKQVGQPDRRTDGQPDQISNQSWPTHRKPWLKNTSAFSSLSLSIGKKMYYYMCLLARWIC